MANRIKLAGTTANAFQIGLKGPILNSNNVTTGYQLNLPANVGANAQVLTTDGLGNLSWSTPSGGGNGTPGGTNTQVQFNDDGAFGGSAALTFDKTSNVVSAAGNISANYFIGNGSLLTGIASGVQSSIANGNSNVNIPAANGNIQFSANTANSMTITSSNVIIGNGAGGIITAGQVTATGNITANFFIGNGSALTGLSTTSISNGNSNVRVFANANVTISSVGNANIVVVTGTGANVAGTLNVTGIATFNGNANLRISGGSNGQVLTTDGNSNLSWANGGGGGNGTAILNGNSNVIVSANSNVTMSVAGIANLTTFTNANVIFGTTGSGGNILGANVISANTANVITISVTGNIGNANVITANTINVSNINVTAISNLGNVGNVIITGGSNNQVLTTNGSGNLNWTTPTTPTKDYLYAFRNAGLSVATANTIWTFPVVNANSGLTYDTTSGNLSLTGGKTYRISLNSVGYTVTVGVAGASSITFGWVEGNTLNQVNANIKGTIPPDINGGSGGTYAFGSGTIEFFYTPGSNANIRLATIDGSGETFNFNRGTLLVQEI